MSKDMRYSTSPLLAERTPMWRSRFIMIGLALAFTGLIGRAAYVQQESGFCYAQGYEIAKVRNIAANPMGAAVDNSWVVTVDIRQKPIADWANTPAIEKLARNPENLSEVPKTYHVVVGRLKGEQTLKLIDPRFSIMRGVGVNQAF